ncbi:MAG: DUF1566 domain-containing protein [Porticoccaceae bacterium]
MLYNAWVMKKSKFRSVFHTIISACYLYGAMATNDVLAMSPPPPEPSPEPLIPQIDPKPGTPRLSIDVDLSKTEVQLNWYTTRDAEYYSVYAYLGGQWRYLEDIRETVATYDFGRRGWDISELRLKILACKAKPWYVAIRAWEWGDNRRCSDYSNAVQLPQFHPTFRLSSYAMNLNSAVSSYVDPVSSDPMSSSKLDNPSDPVGAVRYIVATLRLTDRSSGDFQDVRWPIDLNTNNFTITSNKTIVVKPGDYNIEFLATDGDVNYVALALNVTLSETQQTIPLELKTVLGDSNVTIDSVIELPEFQFQYDPAQLTEFTQPKIGVVIDGGNEVLLTLNPTTGITDQYLSISAGQHHIGLTFYDGLLLKGRSRPGQENRTIVPGQPFVMDLVPLNGETTVSQDTVGGEAIFKFAIPKVAVEEVGGDPANLQVMLSLNGINNQPGDVMLSNLTYNATSDVYEAQHTYPSMQADSQVTLSLTFTDLGAEPDQLLGHCVSDNIVLNSDLRTIACQLTLRRRAIVGGNLLAVLGINVFDSGNAPVAGASVYAKLQGSQDADLGTLLGLTGSGSFGTTGYLKTYLVPGSYQLTAKYAPIDGTAQQTISLSAFEVTNQDLTLDKALDQNQAPNISITAPNEDTTTDSSYTIQWTASDPDNQANISLYYDSDNSDYDGTLIAEGLVEGTDTSHEWNTSALTEGDYYIYAKIDDGVNTAVYAYSSGKITISHAAPPSVSLQVKINDTGIIWGGNYPSGNNTDCTGVAFAQQDCSHGRDAQARAGTLEKIGGGVAGFDFTRLNADGSQYAASGDYNSDPWGCVKDNHTGLTWEIKTDDGGIHDKDNTYRWGGKTTQVNESARTGNWGDYYDDWDTLVDGSNNENFCGFADWRVPTLMELMTITNKDTFNPAVDSNYFPNVRSSDYWSSSPYAGSESNAWRVSFGYGYNAYGTRSDGYHVRLVRSGE